MHENYDLDQSLIYQFIVFQKEALPGGASHFTRLNFKTSRVSGYKCLSLIVGFAVTVTIWLRRLSLVAISFYVLSLLFGPCRLSEFTLAGPPETCGRIAMASFA